MRLSVELDPGTDLCQRRGLRYPALHGIAGLGGDNGGTGGSGSPNARHVKAAIDLARLCSNDPVCAEHIPDNAHETRFLHGAACHGCLLIPETCCEQQNDFLDRSLVVSTVDQRERSSSRVSSHEFDLLPLDHR